MITLTLRDHPLRDHPLRGHPLSGHPLRDHKAVCVVTAYEGHMCDHVYDRMCDPMHGRLCRANV